MKFCIKEYHGALKISEKKGFAFLCGHEYFMKILPKTIKEGKNRRKKNSYFHLLLTKVGEYRNFLYHFSLPGFSLPKTR